MAYGASVYDELGAARPTTWQRQRFAQPAAASGYPAARPAYGSAAAQPARLTPHNPDWQPLVAQRHADPYYRPPYDPNNPYAFLNVNDPTYAGVTSRLLGQAGGQGYLGVNDPNFRALYTRHILQGGDARRRRAMLLSQLAGLDPAQQREALLNADIEASGQTSQQLTDADLQAVLSDRDFARSLLGTSLGHELELGRMGAEEQAAARAHARANRGGFKGFLGQAGGALLGGLLGPGGLGSGLIKGAASSAPLGPGGVPGWQGFL